MLRLREPETDPSADYDACVDSAIARRRVILLNCRDDVMAKFAEYVPLANTGELCKLNALFGAGSPDNGVLEGNYDNVVGKSRVLRILYEKTIAASKSKLCPYCAARDVKTVDHYLSKSRYGEYAAYGPNLVPSCSDCNKLKYEKVGANDEGKILHPYYDDAGNSQFMYADIIYGGTLALSYKTIFPDNFDQTLRNRIELHVHSLDLCGSYATKAAQELTDLPHNLEIWHRYGGPGAVKEYLDRTFLGCQNGISGPNGWRSVMYQALASDALFCDGGFRQLNA